MTMYTGSEWCVFARISECGTEIRGIGMETNLERFKYVRGIVVLSVAEDELSARVAFDAFSNLLNVIPADNFSLRSQFKWLPDEQMRVARMLATGASTIAVAAAVQRSTAAITYWIDKAENRKLVEQLIADGA